MKNIIEYLWQVDEAIKFNQSAGPLVVCGGWVSQSDETVHWYFYSEKQGKLLRKKRENTVVAKFLEAMDLKRRNGHAGICVRRASNKASPIEKYIMSNTQLVELMHSPQRGYLFVNVSDIGQLCLYEATYDQAILTVKPFQIPQLSQINRQSKQKDEPMHMRTISEAVPAIISCLQRKLTFGKSRVQALQLIIGVAVDSSKLGSAYVVWSDLLLLENDYYQLSYDYTPRVAEKDTARGLTQRKITSKLPQQPKHEPWQCEGCLKHLTCEKFTTELSQEDALTLRGLLGLSKYGLMGRESVEVCQQCIQTLRNR